MTRETKSWPQSTRAVDASAQSDRVVVVGVVDSRRGIHVELFSWERPGSSQRNGKCTDLPLQQQGCISVNFL